MNKMIPDIKSIAIVLLTTISLIASNSSFASDLVNNNKSRSEVKFVGTLENLPVLQLELNSNENAQYFITVRNSEKRILLYEKLKGTNILRRYKLYAEDVSRTQGTTIEVINKKTKETLVFTIKDNNIIEQNVTDFKSLMRSLSID